MDDVVLGSLVAIRDLGVHHPELWFDLVSEVYEDLERRPEGATLEEFGRLFVDRVTIEGFGPAAEEFLHYAEYNGGIDVVRLVSRENRGDVLDAFERLTTDGTRTDDTRTDDGEDYDEDAWNAFLVEYGGRWNGEDDSWDQFAEWFLYHAAERSLASPATAFVEYVADQPDRIEVFERYGVSIAAAEEGEAATDLAGWYAFLDTYGPGWNGDLATWEQFKDWFLFYAEEHGVERVARNFVEYAESEPDRAAFFAEYGLVVGERT